MNPMNPSPRSAVEKHGERWCEITRDREFACVFQPRFVAKRLSVQGEQMCLRDKFRQILRAAQLLNQGLEAGRQADGEERQADGEERQADSEERGSQHWPLRLDLDGESSEGEAQATSSGSEDI